MGAERAVVFGGRVPAWADVSALLARHGAAVQMRMIDGELSMPDALPADDWRELRVALAGEMITVRRGPDRVALVAWGNPTLDQRRLWNVLAWAFAVAGDGKVEMESGAVTAAELAAAEMPPGWKA
jgi:hypothetical protein